MEDQMTGLFKVHYFYPKDGASNVDAYTVIARHGEEAVRKANRMKLLKGYRVEWIECLGWSDE
jgi:hypothetical protein